MKPSATQCQLADLVLLLTTAITFPDQCGDQLNNQLFARIFKTLDEHYGQVIDS